MTGHEPVQTNGADTLARFKDAPDSGRKELIVRTLGEEDRRLMQFHLSQSGKKLVRQLALEKVEIPELLKPLFESVDS